MKQAKYQMSFSTGGLFYHESVKIAELYFDLKDWTAVKEQVRSANLIQARIQSSVVRVSREIISRLKLLTEEQLAILCDGSRPEQFNVLWVAVCKRYKFIHDFAVEVIREKFLRMDMVLSSQDYDAFFNTKAEWHEELEQLRDSTQKKLRQVVFKMLHEAELISKTNTIIPTMLTHRVARAIIEDRSSNFAVFPVSDTDVKEWAK